MKQPKAKPLPAVRREWYVKFEYKNSLIRSCITGTTHRQCGIIFPSIITNQKTAIREAYNKIKEKGYDPKRCYNITIQLWR